MDYLVYSVSHSFNLRISLALYTYPSNHEPFIPKAHKTILSTNDIFNHRPSITPQESNKTIPLNNSPYLTSKPFKTITVPKHLVTISTLYPFTLTPLGHSPQGSFAKMTLGCTLGSEAPSLLLTVILNLYCFLFSRSSHLNLRGSSAGISATCDHPPVGTRPIVSVRAWMSVRTVCGLCDGRTARMGVCEWNRRGVG